MHFWYPLVAFFSMLVRMVLEQWYGISRRKNLAINFSDSKNKKALLLLFIYLQLPFVQIPKSQILQLFFIIKVREKNSFLPLVTYPCFEFWSMYLFEICVFVLNVSYMNYWTKELYARSVCVCAGKFECKFDSFQVLRLRMKVVQVCKCQCTSQVVQVWD